MYHSLLCLVHICDHLLTENPAILPATLAASSITCHLQHILFLVPLPQHSSMDSESASSLWKRRWGTAFQWESLVRCREFRQNATLQVYDIHSNTKLYQDEPPGGLNYCANCAAGHRYECLFFHPTISDIFLDLIKKMGRTKLGSIDHITNLDFLDRVFRLLPAHFTQLGYPCQLGGIWRCIVDKLDQTFPLGVLLMLNIPSFIQCNEPSFLDVYECCEDGSNSDGTGSSEEEEEAIKDATIICPFPVSTAKTQALEPLAVFNPYQQTTQKKLVVKKKQSVQIKHFTQRK